jgi:hypothetical protein
MMGMATPSVCVGSLSRRRMLRARSKCNGSYAKSAGASRVSAIIAAVRAAFCRYRMGSKAEGREIRETRSGLEYEALIFN